MANEALYYSNNNFAFYIDDEGRIIDTINKQAIGICNQKKNEILTDYNALAEENKQLKNRLYEIESLLEKHAANLPSELKKIIEKPPTVESLQVELAEMKGMRAEMSAEMIEMKGMITSLLNQLNERGNATHDVDSGAVPEVRTKPGSSKRSRGETELIGDKLEQPE